MGKLLCVVYLCTLAVSPAFGWTTHNIKDDFTGLTTAVFVSGSKNSLNLVFPYEGRNFGRLWVSAPNEGYLNVYLSIQKGQIVCPTGKCTIAIKFGDKPPRNFAVLQDLSGGDSSSVRFSYPPSVLEELYVEKDFVARILVFGNGAQDLHFENSEPLDSRVAK